MTARGITFLDVPAEGGSWRGATVPSMSSDGLEYQVDLRDPPTCTCPAYTFGRRKAGRRECKHIRLSELAARAEGLCEHLDGGVCLQCLVRLLALVARKQR